MKFSFTTFIVSTSILFLAWIAKLHFVFGGDYLFRIGTVGIIFSIVLMMIKSKKEIVINASPLVKLFLINGIGLIIVYLGMMLKVSHIMDSQFEKDLVLDFIGIPAIVACMLYTFANISRIWEAEKAARALFYKHIILAWVLFLWSFLLYAIYSAVLIRALL